MRIIKNQGLANEWSLSLGRNQPTVFRSLTPDEDDLRSFLMAFRKFISKDEPVFIAYIHNLCFKHFTSDELKGYVKSCKEEWRENVTKGGVRLNFNGRTIGPEHIADLWINGHYFHDDPSKLEELKRYMPFARFVIRQEFLQFIIEATYVVWETAYPIKMALRDGALSD